MKTPAPSVLYLALCASFACSETAGNVGTADAADGAPNRRSYEIVATLTPTSDAGANVLPPTNQFTLQIDPAAGRAIGGGWGEAKSVALASKDGTFGISTTIGVGVSQAACLGLQRLAYETLDFTIAGGTLTGRAAGHAFFAGPDATPTPLAFEANLEGVPDTTPPFLIVPPGWTAADPLAPFHVWVSEPLPVSALARLVGGDGAVAGFASEISLGDVPIIASFAKPAFTLPPGQNFDALFSDDVTDLAGNAAPLGVALRLPSFGDAPLLPPDGFESATETVSGAAIVRSGPGIPIAGAASAYIGQANSPAPPGLALSPRLVVRMAVPPGATKLSFSYRALALGDKGDVGAVQIGSVGGEPGLATPIPVPANFTTVTWAPLSFEESSVATMQVSLPEVIDSEVVVVIRSSDSCGAEAPGLLIDDLRFE